MGKANLGHDDADSFLGIPLFGGVDSPLLDQVVGQKLFGDPLHQPVSSFIPPQSLSL